MPLARFPRKTHRFTVTSGESVRFSATQRPSSGSGGGVSSSTTILPALSSATLRTFPCHAGRSTFACISARTSPSRASCTPRCMGWPQSSSRRRAPGRPRTTA